MDNNKEIKKDQQLSQADIERMELLQRANEKAGRQLSINPDTGNLEEIDELRQLVGKQFDNPEEKYNLYYNGIRRLLMSFLPKGKEFKEVRDIIYDEKNIFLNLGKRKSDNNGIRKSDGRMTFQPVMNEILDIIVEWVGNSQNPFVLYKSFYDLNEKHGYGHEEYDKSTAEVAKAMMKLNDK
ncbi:hypothetical protein GCM10022386_07780 [Flavobacterium cheonhonense]|uniref:Uncharacterized protein n=1 Tax=Flavobacterium cheonhonense TaxID=706185 RepID=A0ABP7TIL2_9FLAO|nr:hypothetical protein [Flavobacterium cheonhonense]